MRESPRLDLCEYHYAVVMAGISEMGAEAVMVLLELVLGVPPGGLDRVLILRAEGPPRYEGGRRHWAQLRLCHLCSA